MNPTLISINGVSLQQISSYPFVITTVIDHESLATKTDTAYDISHANQSFIPNVNYPKKPIKLSGSIVSTSKQLYEAERDLFMSYFNGTKLPLIINFAGNSRQYTVTADKITVVRDGTSPTMSKWSAELTATLPFGTDVSTTTLVTYSGTAQSYNWSPTFSGTAPWQSPVITVTLQTYSGTSGSVSIGSAYTGQQATVTSTAWAPYVNTVTPLPVLTFDSTANTISCNGNIIQYSGALPQFYGFVGGVAQSNEITYSDTFSTRSVLVSAVYQARWL